MPNLKLETELWKATSPLIHVIILFGLSIFTYNVYRSAVHVLPLRRDSPRSASHKDFSTRCLKFMPQIPNAQIELIEYIRKDSQAQLSYRHPTCGGPGLSGPLAEDICRIGLYVSTSGQSGIHLEAWLPVSWNHRFLGTGNGGINGCLDYASLIYTTAQGFAAVAANNGHNGTGGLEFYHNPNVVQDYADRSVHTSVTMGKALIKQFYGSAQRKSYFLGCSQGGRQGIANALKFPNDFDGIVAGSPALDFNSLVSWRASFYPLTGLTTAPDFITPDLWSGLIHHEVLRQCDGLDGVRDGIIEYPGLCNFKPELLLCKSDIGPGDQCLNERQVDQVRRIFAPLTHSDGILIYPGMQLGSEQSAIDRLYAGKPYGDSQDWFRYVVHSDPNWDPATFTTEDARKAQQLNPFDIRTYPSSSDLLPFRVKGGKILSYHGMQDQQITGHNTARWMDYLLSQSSEEDVDKWLRTFRISGMLHCSGGPGAWMIGQTGGSASLDPKKNVLSALVEWVEHGVAPETIEGTSLAYDSKSGWMDAVTFTRRHCRYPKRNYYIGQQSPRRATAGIPAAIPSSSTADQWVCR